VFSSQQQSHHFLFLRIRR